MPRVLGTLSSRGRLLAYTLAALAVLLAAALLVLRTIASRTPSFDLVVEMEAPGQAQRLHAYFNSNWNNPRRLFIEDGRRTYVFSGIPPNAKSLRLDWVAQPGLQVTFHRIEIRNAPRASKNPGVRLVSFDPLTWAGVSTEGVQRVGAGRLAATAADPMLLIDQIPDLLAAAGNPKDPTGLRKILGAIKAPMAPLTISAAVLSFLLLARGSRRIPPETMAQAWPWLVVVLIVAICLRLPGIWWSVPTDTVPLMTNLDEVFTMAMQINLHPFAGRIVTEGYREGMLLYYINGLVIACLNALGLAPSITELSGYNSDYGRLLAIGRVVMVAFAAGSIALVFLIVLRVTRSAVAAAVASLSLAVAPFPVVFTLSVRTHEVANFFFLLVAYFSLDLIEQRGRRPFVLVGALLGLVAAVRFNMAVTLGIPLTTLFVAAAMEKHESHAKRLLAALRAVTSVNVALMVLVAGLVWLLLHPGYIIATEEVRRMMSSQFAYMGFGSSPFSKQFFEKFVRYLTEVFPAGARPLLWVLYYAAAAYALTLRRYWTATVPLVSVGIAYLAGMVWSYPFGFLRTVLLLFPIFAILVGIAFADAWEAIRGNIVAARTAIAALAAVLAAAAAHSLAYRVSLLGQTPRQELWSYLQSRIGERPGLKIGAYDPCKPRECVSAAWDAFHPVERALRGKFSSSWFEGAPKAGEFDYVIVSQLLDFERSQPSAAVAALGQPGGYAIDTVIGRRPSLWGITFDYKDYPWEMGVHFPTFYVLKAGALR